MSISFRKMEIRDLDEVYSIESEVFSDPWPKEIFEMEMEHDAFVLIKDEHLIGYMCSWQVLDECTITNVSIKPEFQRQGFGANIFHELFSYMDKREVRFYYLEVRASNQAATMLYNKLGFTRIGLRKSYYHNPVEDAVVMAFDINQRIEKQ